MVMASHNRCGAASPARHFVSLPPLATAPFWDWCLHDSEIVFGVSIFFGIYNVMHYVILGISTALMGVTRSTFRLRDANLEHLTGIKKKYDDMWRTPHPIGPDQLVVQGSISSGTISKFCVVNSLVKSATYMTSSSRVLFQGPGFSYGHNANNKWWLYHFRNLSGVPSLIVADLSDQSNVFHQADEQQPQQHGVLTVVCPPYEGHSDSEYSEWKQLECSHVSFNNSIPDEALLVFDSLATAELLLVLIDVKSTYITNTTVVLSTTRWLSPDILYFASTRALVMRLHPPACKLIVPPCINVDAIYNEAEYYQVQLPERPAHPKSSGVPHAPHGHGLDKAAQPHAT
ncbi:hypothetical protein Pelo_6005 [Pelomyxa schiedti]|nr:hypothetical protein Pelo_6005 [Pelomyxa schiedti]